MEVVFPVAGATCIMSGGASSAQVMEICRETIASSIGFPKRMLAAERSVHAQLGRHGAPLWADWKFDRSMAEETPSSAIQVGARSGQ